MVLSLGVPGSLAIDVNGSRLDCVFVGTDGAAADYFTMIKGPPAPTNAPATTGGQQAPVETRSANQKIAFSQIGLAASPSPESSAALQAM
jgi:hypothetical protein